MNQSGDRPSIPMKGQPASAKPPVVQHSVSVGASASRKSDVFAALRRTRRRRWLQSPSMIALAVISSLAIVIGLATLFDRSSTAPDVGEAADPAGTSSNSTPSGTTPTTLMPGTAVDLEALAISSVVSIDVYNRTELCSGGTGSVVLDGNFVLTNLHVVEDDSEFDCVVSKIVVRYLNRVDQDPIPGFTAKIVATDRNSDLAVLQLTRQPSVTKLLAPVGVGSDAVVNEDLFIAGFPLIGGDSITFSRGIVSGFVLENGVRWIKTDAQISGGNSGGPAFNSLGELIGVPTRASASPSGKVVDCRIVEDTNGDGRINDRDACVPIGGSFSLLSPASAVEKLLKSVRP